MIRSFFTDAFIYFEVFIVLTFGGFRTQAQNGTAASPYTALGQAQNVTTDGVYYFNLTGTTFSTYVISGGWVQVAFDYGNGVGNLPQVTALTNTARGILSPTVLSKLGSANKVRISSDYTNFAITSSNATHVTRIVNNACLHTGTGDNGLQGSWTGNTGTLSSGCNSNSNNGLHQRIFHAACNGGGFHWVPKDNNQAINLSLGDIPNASYFQLWVQAPMVATLNPVINTQPTAATYCVNNTATALSVTATSGYAMTYQWYKNGTAISGATNSTYMPSTTAVGSNSYYVIVSNVYGTTTSSSVNVNVSAASVAGTVSSNQTICAGSQPANITLSGNTGTVQWQFSSDNSNFSNIVGATNSILTSAQMGVLTATRYYRAIITNTPCTSVTSATVTVTCSPIPVIATTSPESVCNSGALTLGATTSSGTINWYAASIGGSSLATGTSFTTPNLTATTNYYVDVTLNGCTSSPRTTITATINAAPPLATNTPSSLSLDVLVVGGGGGGSARHGGGGGGGQVITTTSTITAGNSVPVTIGAGGAGGQNGVTPSTAIMAPNTAAYGSNSGGHGGTSSFGTINALGGAGGPVAISSRAGGNSFSPTNIVYAGGSPSWNPNASTNGYSGGGGAGSGGNGTNSSPTGSTSVNATAGSGGSGISSSISGSAMTYGGGGGGGCANNAAAAGNGTDGGGNGGKGAAGINAVANRGGGGGGSGFNLGTNYTAGNGGSGIVIIRYLGTPQATGGTITQIGGYTIHTFTTNGTFAFAGTTSNAVIPNVTSCGSAAVTFNGTVSSGLTLDWYSAATGGTLLANGTTSYTTPVISSNTTYYVEVRNSSTGCVSASRLAVTATINSVSSISSNQTLCAGSIPAGNIVLTSASGSIQWQSSTNNVSFTNISGQSSATLSAATIGVLSQTTYFRAVVTNGACLGNSPVCTITVNNPTFATTPAAGNMIWRGTTSTDWNTAANWYAYNGTTYSVATAVPNGGNKVIVPANQACVLAQPSVNISTAAEAKDLVIETGATLTMTTGTLNVNGDFTNNGSFVAGTGIVNFNSAGSVSGNPTSFNHVSIANGVNFGSNISTINGILTINTNGWVNTNPPIYGTSSLLKYNSGGTYGRGAEWSTNTGGGYPNDVQVSNNTILDFPNTSGSYATNRSIARDLIIDAGSSLLMDYGMGAASGSLTVGRDITILGNLSMGDAIGGNILIGGNWLHLSGTFTTNNRVVCFNGAGAQTITATGGENFASVVVNKPSGNLILANNSTISQGLTLTNGLIEVGTNTLALGSATLIGGSPASYVKTASTGVLSRSVGGTATTFPVGNSAYNPAILTNIGTVDVFTLRVVDNVTADGSGIGTTTPDAVVNRTWMLSETITGESNVTLRLNWNGSPEEINSFSSSLAFISHYIASAGLWDNIGSTAQGTGYIETNGITNFSPFSISSSSSFAPLPIELVSFKADCQGDNKVKVTWTTASEHNTSHFTVEHSRNGNDWSSLTMEGAAVNSTSLINYTYVHENAPAGINYYRLIQYDNDGKFEQYNVVSALCHNQNSTTSLSSYPNPSSSDFFISLYSENTEYIGQISFTDTKGTLVYKQNVSIQKGETIFHMENLNLAPGLYYIKFTDGKNSTEIVKHSLH